MTNNNSSYLIAVLSRDLGTLLLLHLLRHVGAHLARHGVALLPSNLANRIFFLGDNVFKLDR
jgi:hypothetical protein